MKYLQIRKRIQSLSETVENETVLLNAEQIHRLKERYGRGLEVHGVRVGRDFIAIPALVLECWKYLTGLEYVERYEITPLYDYAIYPDTESSGRVFEMMDGVIGYNHKAGGDNV